MTSAGRIVTPLVGFCIISGIVATCALLWGQGRTPVPPVRPPAGFAEPANVELIPVQLSPNNQGFVILDKQNHTMCLYQYQATRPAHERLVLLAARSFRYDTQLEDYNTAEPRPEAVRRLLEQAREGEPGPNIAPPNAAPLEALPPR